MASHIRKRRHYIVAFDIKADHIHHQLFGLRDIKTNSHTQVSSQQSAKNASSEITFKHK